MMKEKTIALVNTILNAPLSGIQWFEVKRRIQV